MRLSMNIFRETKKPLWACPFHLTWTATIHSWPNYKSLLLTTWWLHCATLTEKPAFCPENGMMVSKTTMTKAFRALFTATKVGVMTIGEPVLGTVRVWRNWTETSGHRRVPVVILTRPFIENGPQREERFSVYKRNICKRIINTGWPR